MTQLQCLLLHLKILIQFNLTLYYFKQDIKLLKIFQVANIF